MDTEQPSAAEHDAQVYRFPTLRQREMRRHPASGNETIDGTLGRIGINPVHEDSHAPVGSIFEQMGMIDDGDDDEPDKT